MCTYTVFYTKGLVFGSTIGVGIGCLFTNIYVRNTYKLIPLNISVSKPNTDGQNYSSIQINANK
jgi:hypothetical protein